MTPSISYLVTVHNETQTLENLLGRLTTFKCPEDEIVIVDDYSDDIQTHAILTKFQTKDWIYLHRLNNDYGAHKNYGITECKNDWIFQLDADELPPFTLVGENIKELINSNPQVELFWIPRINDFKGVTPEHAARWNWTLSMSPTYNRPIINWDTGDYQGRLFKRDYPRIHWEKKLHEQITGHNSHAPLPKDESWAIYHDKTIEKQEESNIRYMKNFTPNENMGIK